MGLTITAKSAVNQSTHWRLGAVLCQWALIVVCKVFRVLRLNVSNMLVDHRKFIVVDDVVCNVHFATTR